MELSKIEKVKNLKAKNESSINKNDKNEEGGEEKYPQAY